MQSHAVSGSQGAVSLCYFRGITMDPAAPATRMTSSFTINISTPSFYNQPKKFAPVVPPKPKVNPFRASEDAEPKNASAGSLEGPGVKAFLGKVGDIPPPAPSSGEQEEFVLPPPPPSDDSILSPTVSFPPPPPSFSDDVLGSPTSSFPPPPPPEFAEPFPPPAEELFPSPPPPEEASDIQVPPPPPAPPIPAASAPKPAAPVPSKPSAPATFTPKAPPPAFTPKPAGPPSSFSPKAAPAPVAPKPASPFVPKVSAPHTFSPSPPAANPPPAQTFSPKPGATSFSPKPTPSHTFTPKPSAPQTLSSRPTEPSSEVPRPEQKFPPSQPVVSEPPASSAQSSGFNYAHQREKPQVLEKARPHENVRIPVPQMEPSRNFVPQESIKSGVIKANGTPAPKPQPEHFQAPRPQSDGVQTRGPLPSLQRPSEPNRTAGSTGLNMKEVEELEMLTQQLMQEMDKQPAAEGHTMDLCGFCGKGLSRTETVVRAGEHLFHVHCFTCSKCDQQLQGQQYYENKGRPLCEDCYQDLLECCAVCQKKITERLLKAMGKAYHPECFTCAVCRRPLQGEPFIVDQNNQPHCVADYHRRYAPRCSVCGDPIAPEPGRDETVRVVALEKNFHMMCYKCEDCGCNLSVEADDSGCFPLEGHVLCKKCHISRSRAVH